MNAKCSDCGKEFPIVQGASEILEIDYPETQDEICPYCGAEYEVTVEMRQKEEN